jgi:centromeric protein E
MCSCQKKSDQEQFRGRAGELLIPQDPCDGNDALRHKNTVPCVVSSLSSRESEAILVIKQLQDQVIVFTLVSSCSGIEE